VLPHRRRFLFALLACAGRERPPIRGAGTASPEIIQRGARPWKSQYQLRSHSQRRGDRCKCLCPRPADRRHRLDGRRRGRSRTVMLRLGSSARTQPGVVANASRPSSIFTQLPSGCRQGPSHPIWSSMLRAVHRVRTAQSEEGISFERPTFVGRGYVVSGTYHGASTHTPPFGKCLEAFPLSSPA